MKLIVLGKPFAQASPSPYQTTVVTYDPYKQITTIDCDMDIITLGLAVNVLTEQYESYLQKLDPKIAHRIRAVTKKAVGISEEY